MLPISTTLQANRTGRLQPPLPSLHTSPRNVLYLPSPREYHILDWERGLREALLGSNLLGASELVYSDDPWASRWNQTSAVCFHHAVLFGESL